jgi:ATP-dependent DNA helicase RecQ
MADRDQLLETLRTLTARPDAEFRSGQREAVEALVEQRARVLVVQRTGWGKSAVYFLSTHLLRERGLGPTLLISPLLALMRNQIEAAERLGLRSETINSASATTIAELEAKLQRDEVDLLLVSPERLANPEFGNTIMPLVGRRPGLIVIDEVHCISDWGHDFRPDYRRIGRMIDRLAGTRVPILGCTATANDRVVADVVEQLGAELTTFRGPLRRDGLALRTIRLDRQAERLAWLAEALPQLDGSGIVYCLTVRDVETVVAWLTTRGIAVEPYFGSLDAERRLDAEHKLRTNQIKALVATTALGMGYDKPDLSFVIHYQSPGSPVGYYQQVGRAGRAIETSQGVLLQGLEDRQIQDHFIESAFAEQPVVEEIVRAFDEFDGPVPMGVVQSTVNVKRGVLDLVLKQLDVDGVLDRVRGTVYERTSVPWSYPTERVAEITAARRAEQQSMVEYLGTSECRMRFLANLLDDPADHPCGVCDNCTGSHATPDLSTELVAEAERFVKKQPITLTPRKMFLAPTSETQRRIPSGELVGEGRVLAIWGDSGWGRLVRDGRQQTGRFDDRLVDALVEMIQEWAPEPAPEWVTAVPSLRQPDLVPGVAEQVAARLGLPYDAVLTKVVERPPQTTQQNSAHQQHNVEGAFEVTDTARTAPVLLIDDLVDSTWTITEVGRQLRRAGTTQVHPVVLASASGRT